jgi:cation:H+ antiporter
MDMLTALGWVVAGLVALIAGGELLVRSAARMAADLGISPLVIGLTVVAFGTSAPELAVVLQAALAGQADLAIGNSVGSNIFNILFVLGLSALIAPLVVEARLIRLDVPLMIGASVLLLLLALDGRLGRGDGGLLFALLLVYVIWTIRQSRQVKPPVREEFAKEFHAVPARHRWLRIPVFLCGLALLVVGARFAVDGCVDIATLLGVSELIIGLTVVAVGTSLPEVVTSVVASYRGERDIAVGNVVGSNLLNILCVLGLGSLAAGPEGIPVARNAIRFDMPVMIAVAVACLPIFFVGHRISRWEGGLLLAYYVAYTGYLILHASGHGFGRVLAAVLLLFVIPLTLITLGIAVYRYQRLLRQRANQQ